MGYKILLEKGFTKEEIDSLDAYQVRGTADTEEYIKGNITMEIHAGLINEHGEKFDAIPVQAYFNESYEEALKRELDEKGIVYDPNNILESAIDVD